MNNVFTTQPAEPKPTVSYTIPEAARSIGICTKNLHGLIRDGKIRTFQIGYKKLISVEALKEFVAASERATAA